MWPAERGHHHLIKAARRESGEQVMPQLPAQRDGGENPRVIEEQRDLNPQRENSDV